MAVVINAKGTSIPYFTIGKNGTTIYQGSADPYPVYTTKTGDIWFDSSTNSIKVWSNAVGSPPTSAWVAPRLGNIKFDGDIITAASGHNVRLEPPAGNYLYLNVNKWPSADGTNGQVLTTDGSGNLSWQEATISNTGSVLTNAVFYVPFLSANTTSKQGTNTASNLSFNPNTGTLWATTFNVAQASTGSNTYTSVNTSANQVIDTLDASVYRTVKYLIQVTSGSSYQTTELLVIHNGTNAYATEYGTINTGSSLATFDTTYDSGSLKLLATPANASTTFKMFRTSMSV